PGCVIGMEAGGGVHHWARAFQARGITVKLIAPQFVKPYVKSNKNDANDAEAICDAISRPNMRFVAVKTIPEFSLSYVQREPHDYYHAVLARNKLLLVSGMHRMQAAWRQCHRH